MSSALFSPFRLAGLELANRIVVSPMCQYSGRRRLRQRLASDASRHAGAIPAPRWWWWRRPMSSATAASPMAAWACIPTTTKPRLARVIAQCRRIGTAKFGIQIAHSGRKGSAQRPWEGGGALKPDADPWPTMAASPIPFGENWHTPREVTEADMDARARRFRLRHQARAAHRLRRDRAAHGARLSGARLHVADLQQAHRPIWRLVREPHALSALDRARGARGGAEGLAARRAHHRQRLARGRADARRRGGDLQGAQGRGHRFHLHLVRRRHRRYPQSDRARLQRADRRAREEGSRHRRPARSA